MATLFNMLRKTIFWLTVVFISVAVFALTFAQASAYEFADWRLSRKFYDLIMAGLPVAVLLTLTGTIKRTNNKSKNITIVVATITGTIVTLFILVSMTFSVGFLTITNHTLLYRLRTNPNTTIMVQHVGQGAFGADGQRIVKLEPFLTIWNKTTIIDTAMINKEDWVFINEKQR